MKRLFVLIFCVLFMISGCSYLPKAQEDQVADTDVVEESSQEEIVTEEITAESPEVEENTTEVPGDAALLEDSAEEKPDEEEKELLKEVEKEKEKKPMPYKIQVDVTNQVVTVFGLDSKGEYTKVVRQMICSTGTSATPTPLGTFTMPGQKGRWGYFKEFDCYAQYWSRIRGGILFHSVIYKKMDESTLSVSSFNNLGKPASHGCIRLQVKDAKWIYDHCAGGTQVVVMKGKKNSKLTAKLKPAPILPKVTTLAVTPNALTMQAGEEKKFTVKATYDDGKTQDITSKATWEVDNKKIVSVDKGTVKGLAAGNAKVTVTFEGQSVTVTVTVNEAPVVPKAVKLAISPAGTVSLGVGEEKQLAAKVTYDDGTEKFVTAETKWSINDEAVASVKSGLVKAKAAGTAKVTAKYGELTAEATVTVAAPEKEETGITLKLSASTVKVGASVTPTVTLVYSDGSTKEVKSDISWKADPEGKVEFRDGKIYGVEAADEVSITATYKGFSKKVKLKVEAEAAPEE